MTEHQQQYKVGDYVEVIQENCFNEHPAGIKGRITTIEKSYLADKTIVLSIRGPEVEPYVDNYLYGNAFLAYPNEVQLTDPPEPMPTETTVSSVKYEIFGPSGNSRGLDMSGTGDDFYDFLTLPEIKDLQTFLNHHFGKVRED